MITIKSPQELAQMREAGRIVAEALALVESLLQPGVSTLELDSRVEDLIRSRGGVPAFKGYRGFPGSICASVNEEVVHGIPSDRVLVEGDVVKIDIGVKKGAFFGDSARSFGVGAISPDAERLIRVCEGALTAGLSEARPGQRLRDVSSAIGNFAANGGFAVVEDFVGHGIGRELHEQPQIPNFYRSNNKADYDLVLREGMTLAIEPMINLGSHHVDTLSDGWTVVTRDRKLSAHFEHTVAVTARGPEVLTAL
jgi:methionyl aminopeptidase